MAGMPRPSQLLYPPAPPPAPIPSATLMLLRDAPGGLQVLLSRRSSNAHFVPGAWVFPGGKLDPEDAALQDCSTRRATQENLAWQLALAAIRETYEEMGILLARDEQGQPCTSAHLQRLDRSGPLRQQCMAAGWQLDAASVWPHVQWVTPREFPRRYDTAFFVARMPAGQVARPDNREQFSPLWLRASDGLQRHADGQLPMILPTLRSLQWLRQFSTVEQVLHACQPDQFAARYCTRAATRNGERVRLTETNPGFAEVSLIAPDGQAVPPLDWQHEKAVALLRNVARLTAPNPGPMTGPGTNSYIVGDPRTGYAVIDPGPADPAHIARLHAHCGGSIVAIICTHAHPDHAPGALPLQVLCHHRPPVLGLPSGPQARPDSRFTPDRNLSDGERIVLRTTGGTHAHTLRVIHTPGHVSNHICLLLEEDGLLFSGDHILGGSTTVIAAPDGHMGAYLGSLDKLAALCEQTPVDFVLPAHGHVLGQPLAHIRELKAHRLAREQKVLAAVRAKPRGTQDDWIALAYADTPRVLWPVARQTLTAHLTHLREQGLMPLS